ncbi:MAG TPA: phosphate ABC transporter substrate-binding/OmpA family protein [Paludibacter sp.]|nr:phosphate ABC transporter substrate-binding/OmpA family protein [Paludibacter sp.]
MATAKLTPLSKLLITLLVVGGIGFALYKVSGNKKIKESFGSKETTEEVSDDVINIGVVTWGGYAGGQYFNEGFKANEKSRFFTDYGFKVNFEVLDDFEASREAFKNGKVDLLWATIDALPTEMEGLAQFDPQVVFQADWSRGGDALVARRGLNTINDLKGMKIAVAPMTPSHSFLLWMLEAADLTVKDVKIVEVPSAIDAADAFKTNSVDAAVVWSPDDKDCVTKVPGARILQSTKNASHIIADVFIAKKKYIQENKAKLQKLYEGWMIGASEINQNEANKKKASEILAEGLNQPADFCLDAINNVRLASHGDNMDFFGLNRDYTGVTGEELYNKMKIKYNEVGYNTANVRSWRLVASDVVNGVTLSGEQHNSEAVKTFEATTKEDVDAEALSSKKVTISFRSGEYTLDENSMQIIDLQFTGIAKAFANAKIRIEGNTDNVGSRQTNISLSKRRAQSVADYLISKHNMPANRFIIVGNGPDKPVAGCENSDTEACRSKNRRTDFEIIANE